LSTAASSEDVVVATSSIQIGGPRQKPWDGQIVKRVEVFDAGTTVRGVLQRIAGNLCYGYFEGI
jgi:hypothetical protein